MSPRPQVPRAERPAYPEPDRPAAVAAKGEGRGPLRFRKSPVEIEAMQWDGSLPSIKAICDWANGDRSDEPSVDYLTDAEFPNPFNVLVRTLEGAMNVKPGDWIIRGVAGEFYPCKPEIFEVTYDAVEEAARVTPGPLPSTAGRPATKTESYSKAETDCPAPPEGGTR